MLLAIFFCCLLLRVLLHPHFFMANDPCIRKKPPLLSLPLAVSPSRADNLSISLPFSFLFPLFLPLPPPPFFSSSLLSLFRDALLAGNCSSHLLLARVCWVPLFKPQGEKTSCAKREEKVLIASSGMGTKHTLTRSRSKCVVVFGIRLGLQCQFGLVAGAAFDKLEPYMAGQIPGRFGRLIG